MITSTTYLDTAWSFTASEAHLDKLLEMAAAESKLPTAFLEDWIDESYANLKQAQECE